MKKALLYMLAGCASLVSMSATAANLTQADKEARESYLKASEKFTLGEYKDALKYLDLAESKLKETNPRISYLRARTQYALENYVEAQKACKSYFSSSFIKDDGYSLMMSLNDEVSLRVDSINKERMQEYNAQRTIAAEKESAALVAAKNRELLFKQAAQRRAQDAEAQKAVKEQESKAFQEVQSKNTKDAYQQFIYDYPSGYFVAQAKNEMNKKWPSLTKVLRKNKYGYVNKSGDLVVKAKYDYGADFTEGMARVSKDGKSGFVNEEGKEIVPLIYSSVSSYSYGWAVVKPSDGEAFFVNKKGEKMNDVIYNDAKSFCEGLAPVQNEYYKYGYIDLSGNEIIPCEYNTAALFHEGLAVVSKKMDNGKILYAYINKSGSLLTQFEFEYANDFQNGIAQVRKNGKYGLIDKFGGPVADCEYDYIGPFNGEGYAMAKKNGLQIYLDKEGVQWAKANGKYIKLN